MIKSICSFGWKEASLADYQQAYHLFGGSVLSDPRILHFFHARFHLNERFFIKHDNTGQLAGGICVWNNRFIAGDKQQAHKNGIGRYPFNFDEIVLPIHPAVRGILPFRTKVLSAINHVSVRNSSHRLNAGRKISIARSVSVKTRHTRNRELRKFTDAGGSFRCLTEYEPEHLIQIYAELFYLRRERHLDRSLMCEVLDDIPDLLFGHVLDFKGAPCAMQWVVKSEDHQRVYLDYVNAGMDTRLPSHLSVGTLAAWVNVRHAFQYGDDHHKQVRFSFGSPTAGYKERWCDQASLYRIIA